MSLTLLHPFFLYLLPLAATPIIFHLFFRMKKRSRPFSTLMFFYRIDPRLSARRRIMEWLILLLRTLLLVFLLLALMRPIWFGAGTTGSVAMAIILDNSGSMSGLAKEGAPKLKVAIEAAQALLASLKEKDSAAVVLLVDDPTTVLPKGLVSDLASLKSALDHVAETEATGIPARALQKAFALFENSTASRFEIHILSDLQEDKWNKMSEGLRTPRAGTTLLVHRIPTPPSREANVSVTGARMPNRRILAGRRFLVSVDLLNSTAVEGRVRVNYVDDQGNKNTQDATLAKNQETSLPILLDPQTPGLHWVSIWIEGDAFQADNRAALAFFCTEKRSVLFAGKSDEFGLLPFAISPSIDGKLSGLVPLFIEPGSLADSLQEKKPVLVVLTWETLARGTGIASLKSYVEEGGNLFVIPPLNGSGNPVSAPDWLGATPDKIESNEKGLTLLAFRKSAGVLTDLRDSRGEFMLRNLKAFKFQPLRVADKENGLLGLEDGRVLLAEHKLAKGTVFTSGLALDTKWSTLPLKGGFLALAQGLALTGADPNETIVSLVAGDRLLTLPGESKSVQIRSLAGSALQWKGEKTDLPVFPRTGIYLAQTGTNLVPVAVRSSDKEGHARFISANKVPALGTLSYAVQNYSDARSLLAETSKLQKSLDLFLPFLLLAIACLLAEGWLANQPPLKKKQAGLRLGTFLATKTEATEA